MPEKKTPPSHSKADDIAALRLRRYMEKGPGAKPSKVPKPPSIEKLRAEIAKVPAKKAKKSRKGKKR
jgi:hypothetical protein